MCHYTNTVLATDSHQVRIGDEDLPWVELIGAAVVLVTLIVACTLCLVICLCQVIYCKKRRARRNYHRVSTNHRDTQVLPEPEFVPAPEIIPSAPEISYAPEIPSAPVAPQRPAATQEQLPDSEDIDSLAESVHLLDDPPPNYDSVVEGDR